MDASRLLGEVKSRYGDEVHALTVTYDCGVLTLTEWDKWEVEGNVLVATLAANDFFAQRFTYLDLTQVAAIQVTLKRNLPPQEAVHPGSLSAQPPAQVDGKKTEGKKAASA